MIRALLLTLLLAAPNVWAADPWSEADIARQVVVETLLVVDWGQTRCIAGHGGGCEPWRDFYEHNPMIGHNPSLSRVNNYFIASLVVNPLIVHNLPSRWRPYFQGFYVAFEGATVNRNREIGLKVRF